MKHFLFILALSVLSACGISSADEATPDSGATPEASPSEGSAGKPTGEDNQSTETPATDPKQEKQYILEKIGDLKPSFYWVALEKNDGAPRNFALKDMDGKVLAWVSQQFWKDIRLEGTGKLLDGRVLNYAGRVNMPDGTREVRYLVCPPEAPYGYGIDFIPLNPFRSVAVDPAVVPMGSYVYIPKAKGTLLPDGTIHDGVFRAVDVGDAIKNHRIDVFTAMGDQSAVFARNGFVHGRAVEVFLIKE